MRILLLVILALALLPLSYAALSDGLQMYVPCTDNGGTSSTTGYPGLPALNWTGGATLRTDGCYTYGTGQYGNTTLFMNNSDGFKTSATICMYLNSSVPTNGASAWGAYSSTGGEMRTLSWYNTNQLVAVRTKTGNSNYTYYSYTGTQLNTMAYICVVENVSSTSSNNIYVNGVPVSTAAGLTLPNLDPRHLIVGGYLHSDTGPSGEWKGAFKQIAVWNRTLTSAEITSLNASGGVISVPLISNFTITANNGITNVALQNFSARVIGAANYDVLWNTTTSSINTQILQNATSLYNITVISTQNGGYFNRTYLNVNVSSNLQATLYQAFIQFTAREIITNNTISTGNVTLQGVNYALGTQFNLTSNVSNATYFSSSYINQTQQFTITPLLNTTLTIENVSNIAYNFSARSLLSGASINTFNISIYSVDYGVTILRQTTSGNISVKLINGTYRIIMDSDSFAVANTTILAVPNQTLQNYRFDLYTTNSINFTFRDEITRSIVAGPNITLQLISSLAAYNYTTNTGSAYLDLLTPTAYTIRYSAPLYTERFSYFELSNRTNNNVTLYMLANSASSNLTATVVDAAGFPVDNALVKLLRYDFTTNTYQLRESIISNNQGSGLFTVTLGTEYYKFIVESPIGTIALETTPEYIYTNTKTLALVNASNIFSSYNQVANSNADVTFNNATNSFRATYVNSDNSVTQGCLYVYRVYADHSDLYNTSCAASSTATLLIPVNSTDGRSYRGDLYLNVGTKSYFADSDSHTFITADSFGITGIFILFIAVLFAVMMFAYNPTLGLPAAGLVAMGLQWAGIVTITPWWPFAIFAIGILAAVLLRRFA